MKVLRIAPLLILIAEGTRLRQQQLVRFGPAGCVSLELSRTGTCVITTECQGQDTSNVEFAFDCDGTEGDAVMRHSFGRGGFDANEQFDTEVRCSRCSAPTPLGAAEAQGPPPPQQQQQQQQQQQEQQEQDDEEEQPEEQPAPPAAAAAVPTVEVAERPTRPRQQAAAVQRPPGGVPRSASQRSAERARRAAPPRKGQAVPPGPPGAVQFAAASRAARRLPARREAEAAAEATTAQSGATAAQGGAIYYGPRGCVSTWRSEEGHCIMQTRCQGADIDDYAFGLVCVDKVGVPVRHLFGKGSFDPEETFDTLIPCEQCLGLEDIPDAIAMNGQVLALSDEIRSLKKMMFNISRNLAGLQQVVFSRGRYAPAPPVVHAPPAAKTEVHHHYHHYHHHQEAAPEEEGGGEEPLVEAEGPPAPVEVPPAPVEAPPAPVEAAAPVGPPQEPPAPVEKACIDFNGVYVDSYESTPVVVAQTGCDITAKWGSAMTVFGKIQGDTILLDYEGWGNPTGKITNGLVTWQTANYWTWTKESAAQDAMEEAAQSEPPAPQAPPAKPCNLRSLSNKLRHLEKKISDMGQESSSLIAKEGRNTATRRLSKAALSPPAAGDGAQTAAAEAAVVDADDDVLPKAPPEEASEDAASPAQGQPALEDAAAPAQGQPALEGGAAPPAPGGAPPPGSAALAAEDGAEEAAADATEAADAPEADAAEAAPALPSAQPAAAPQGAPAEAPQTAAADEDDAGASAAADAAVAQADADADSSSD